MKIHVPFLGHRAVPGDSLACYSRDMLARPLRKLDKMLADVRARRQRIKHLGPKPLGMIRQLTELKLLQIMSLDSFRSPDFPLDLDAERSGARDTAVHLDEEALPLIDSPEPLCVSEEADLVENSPNQRVDEEHETSNPEAMQLSAGSGSGRRK